MPDHARPLSEGWRIDSLSTDSPLPPRWRTSRNPLANDIWPRVAGRTIIYVYVRIVSPLMSGPGVAVQAAAVTVIE